MASATDTDPPDDVAPATTVPVLAEALDVTRERQVTGVVRLEKDVEERRVRIDEPLVRETIRIERHAVDPPRPVDGPPGVRQDGDVTIVPVVEERLVVTKVLVVTEEIHITRERSVRHAPRTVSLRRERVRVERDATAPDTSNAQRGGDPTP